MQQQCAQLVTTKKRGQIGHFSKNQIPAENSGFRDLESLIVSKTACFGDMRISSWAPIIFVLLKRTHPSKTPFLIVLFEKKHTHTHTHTLFHIKNRLANKRVTSKSEKKKAIPQKMPKRQLGSNVDTKILKTLFLQCENGPQEVTHFLALRGVQLLTL